MDLICTHLRYKIPLLLPQMYPIHHLTLQLEVKLEQTKYMCDNLFCQLYVIFSYSYRKYVLFRIVWLSEIPSASTLTTICKWKNIYIRAQYLRSNWKHGRYKVLPVLRGHREKVTCFACNGTLFVCNRYIVANLLCIVYISIQWVHRLLLHILRWHLVLYL